MQVNVSSTTKTHIIVRGTTKTEVFIKTAREKVRVVQSASPLPVVGGGYQDPGDLSLIFDNQLI